MLTLSLGPSVLGTAVGSVLVDSYAVEPNTFAPHGHGKNDIATLTLESPVIVVRSDEYMPSMLKSHCGSDYVASSNEPSDPCDRSVVYDTVLGTSQETSWKNFAEKLRRKT